MSEFPAQPQPPQPWQPQPPNPPAGLSHETLADGEWHRLHPATPLLRGGIFILAILGYVIINLRDRLINLFVGAPGPSEYGEYEEDPIDFVVHEGLVGWALVAIAVVAIVIVVAFYLSWRFHTYRVTTEAVEVRSGILFRTHRKAKLDRIQGINVNRPFLARLVGAAKLEVSVAGQGANMQLAYLGSAVTDGLRRDILVLASGAQPDAGAQAQPGFAPGASAVAAPGVPPTIGSSAVPDGTVIPPRPQNPDFISARVNDLLAPELDPNLAPPESVVKIPPLRIIGSLLLSNTTFALIIAVVVVIIASVTGAPWILFSILPAAIGFASFYWSRFTKSLRYSIAGTPHGVRIGHGLLSTSNETLPPGRIHGIEVSQSLFWRPAGWWEIKINKASQEQADSSGQQQNSIVMPVGDRVDVARVLQLLLPGLSPEAASDLVDRGLLGSGADADFVAAPKRAWLFNPLSWRRVGYAVFGDVLVTRQGFVHRKLVIVPLARVQSVRISQGPWQRRRLLATGTAHTVAGPASAVVTHLDRDDAIRFFERVSHEAESLGAADTSQRWAARQQ